MKNKFFEVVAMKLTTAMKRKMCGGNAAFIIHAGKHSYVLRLRQTYNQRLPIVEYRMDLGGKKKGCVSMSFACKLAGSAVDDLLDELTTYGNIAYVSYDQKCSIDANLEPGNGTKHMLKTALHLALEIAQDFRHTLGMHRACASQEHRFVP